MRSLVFVYGTLMRGEVNHRLLAGAEWVGEHRTEPCFTLVNLGAYPGLIAGGRVAVTGELYLVDGAGLRALDVLEDYPRLYRRGRLRTASGRAWTYLYRGSVRDRPAIPSGDWRSISRHAAAVRSAGVQGRRDAKNPGRQHRLRSRL
jgi:gamma-glutamylcyclotransferase (GGCT)/AIG2-like uncharacterized protein YtfP